MAKKPIPCMFCGSMPCECGPPKRVTARPSGSVRAPGRPVPSAVTIAAPPARTRPSVSSDDVVWIVALQNLAPLLHTDELETYSMQIGHTLSRDEQLIAWREME